MILMISKLAIFHFMPILTIFLGVFIYPNQSTPPALISPLEEEDEAQMEMHIARISLTHNLNFNHPVCPVDDRICPLKNYVQDVVQRQDRAKLHQLVQSVHEHAFSLCMHINYGRKFVPVIPLTLLPSKFPRRIFDQASDLQPSEFWALNLLYFRASWDYEFLHEALFEVMKNDEVVRKMMEIMLEVLKEGGYRRQPTSVNWLRADYMLHKDDDAMGKKTNQVVDKYVLKQIEVNAAAAGGPAMAHRMTRVHRTALCQLELGASLEVLRDNTAETTMAEALHLAWLQFGDPNAIVLSITHRNRHIPPILINDLIRELDRLSRGQMKLVRVQLEDCDDRLKLNPDDFSLRLDDEYLVAIALYRVFPFPVNVPNSEKAWSARRKIERSTAIKSPSIGFHLMNLKKVQQFLAKPGMVEHFFPRPDEAHYAAEIRKTFAGLWGLDNDDDETKQVIRDAIAHPDKYVLKPMKEGGGHNIFGEDIAEKLHEFGSADRATHILQQRLQPPVFQNYMIAAGGRLDYGNMISELSVYGTLVGNGHHGTVQYNRGHGYMVRTKWANSNEGGITIGEGFYDTPYLY